MLHALGHNAGLEHIEKGYNDIMTDGGAIDDYTNLENLVLGKLYGIRYDETTIDYREQYNNAIRNHFELEPFFKNFYKQFEQKK